MVVMYLLKIMNRYVYLMKIILCRHQNIKFCVNLLSLGLNYHQKIDVSRTWLLATPLNHFNPLLRVSLSLKFPAMLLCFSLIYLKQNTDCS